MLLISPCVTAILYQLSSHVLFFHLVQSLVTVPSFPPNVILIQLRSFTPPTLNPSPTKRKHAFLRQSQQLTILTFTFHSKTDVINQVLYYIYFQYYPYTMTRNTCFFSYAFSDNKSQRIRFRTLLLLAAPVRGCHSGSSVSISTCPLRLPLSHQPPINPLSPHPQTSSLAFLVSHLAVTSSAFFSQYNPRPSSVHAQIISISPLSLCLQAILPVLSLYFTHY